MELRDSITLQQITRLQNSSKKLFDVLLYDNSLHPKMTNAHSSGKLYYKHDVTNKGVAGAYNYAMSLGKKLGKEWLVLFDQDTFFDILYFEQVRKSFQLYPTANLFCPVVRSGKTIISPTFLVAEKSISPKNLRMGLLKSRNYTIINSGLIIRLSELETLGGYDSDLPLDFSDHYFFSQYKKVNKQFVLTDYEIFQNFSSDTEKDFETVYTRFKKYSVSAVIYSKKIHNYFPLLWLILRALRLTFRFSRLDFLNFLFFKVLPL